MAVRDEIVWRSGIVYFAIALLAAALLVRILILQYVQRGKWADMSEKFVFKTAEMPANRGDILTSDGRLLASSVPYYTIYMDTVSYTHLRAHETRHDIVCRLLLEKKKHQTQYPNQTAPPPQQTDTPKTTPTPQ